MIYYGKQEIDQSDVDAVINVLTSSHLTQGPKVQEFELKVSEYVCSQFAVAVNSGTSALHIACKALGLQQGDYLWTTPISFAASANCGLYCDANIDFVDVCYDTGLMDLDQLEKKLATAKVSNTLPKIIIPVHYAGHSLDMCRLAKLAKQYSFKIIEDACHALGAQYGNSPVGSCEYSDICVFSFHPVKNITTGEGGMATTNHPDLNTRLRLYASHGITKDSDLMKLINPAPWHMEQQELGFNYRMSDIQAALGINQLTKLTTFVSTRQTVAKYYDQMFDGKLQCLTVNQPQQGAYHLYPVLIDLTPEQKLNVYTQLKQAGIVLQVHYIPIYLHPYYKSLGFSSGYCPEAERFYRNEFSLPIYTSLSKQQQEMISSTLLKFVS